MRTLRRNKKTLWVVKPLGKVEVVDADGFKTGEKTTSYSPPIEVNISMYPTNGGIAERIFGKDASLDMIGISNEVTLDMDTLLFLVKPSANFKTTYDYRVGKINKSLNTTTYGLIRRT